MRLSCPPRYNCNDRVRRKGPAAMSNVDRASVAIHEMGHAVGAVHYGYRFVSVALDATNHGRMYAWVYNFAPDHRAVIALCGPVAQASFLQRGLPIEEGDRQLAEDAPASIPATSRPSGDAIVARATAIVAQHWPMILKGAAMLLSAPRGRLSFDQLTGVGGRPIPRAGGRARDGRHSRTGPPPCRTDAQRRRRVDSFRSRSRSARGGNRAFAPDFPYKLNDCS